ncbi:MAG TPA: zinc ribbon domain-containing protein [Ktedonobacteraceae bacterium]|jgi:hypothetical protein|nr:zinc ribbon domain-containing protein [Ktedonobacteraceae bacterium]
MNCTQCGKNVADDARFCSHCGKVLTPGNGSNTVSISMEKTIEELKVKLRTLERRFEEEQKRAASPPPVRRITGFMIMLFAALMALFSFCFLPYFTCSIETTNGLGGYVVQGSDISISGSQLNVVPQLTGVSPEYLKAFPDFSTFWLQPLIAALLAFVAFYQIIKLLNTLQPEDHIEQRKMATFLLLVLAALTAFVAYQPLSKNIGESKEHFSDYAGIGYWLFIIMLMVVAAGGIVQIISERRSKKTF